MTQRERIATQRAMAQEALGKLKAVAEFFGVEESASDRQGGNDLEKWTAKISALEAWIFDESPIA